MSALFIYTRLNENNSYACHKLARILVYRIRGYFTPPVVDLDTDIQIHKKVIIRRLCGINSLQPTQNRTEEMPLNQLLAGTMACIDWSDPYVTARYYQLLK